MISTRNLPGAILAALLCPLLAAGGTDATGDAVQTLARYFDLLVTGNLESAEYLWAEAAIERSSRFDIKYTGIPLKIDCTSPVISNFHVMRDYLQPPVKAATVLSNGDVVRLEYAAVVGGELVEHNYYAQFDGEYYWLTYPQDHYCRDWTVVESNYFRIHAHPEVEGYLNPAALAEADLFLDRMSDSLGLARRDAAAFKEKKIEYFYCDSDETVAKIAGARTRGTFDLASNDVITSFFPHYHEVMHLLVNVKLRELPLTTLPLLREGVAVHYGGRWGKAATALMNLATFLLGQKIVEIDSLLTADAFRAQATSDIAYPVAGLFTAYLLDEVGQRRFWKLYLSLSGNIPAVQALTDSLVRQRLLQATGASAWSDLLKDFESFVQRVASHRVPIVPGDLDKSMTVVENDSFTISQDRDWLVFRFMGHSSDPPSGNLLFARDKRLADGSSAMFAEQYGNNQPFDGYRFGVRFDANEAGLYDYAGNHLIAKYILGITPSESYFDAERNVITLRLKRGLLGDWQPSADDWKLIPL